MSTPKTSRLDLSDILEKIRSVGSLYLRAWRPHEGEPGWAIARVYAAMYEALGKEVDDLPHRLFISYLDELGFRQAPAKAASVPIVFELAKSFKGGVDIPRGTALESETKVRYETDRDFTAVSSKITAFLEVNPVRNEVRDLAEPLLSQESVTLFEDGGAAAQRPFTFAGNDLNKKGNTASEKKEIAGIETYWIRAKLTGTVPEISDYAVTYKSRSGIDALYHNDVAIDPSRKIYPFGRLPQRNDTFYISSSEAFSKRGAVAGIDFGGSKMQVDSEGTVKFGTGIVSFEYFNGSSWKPLRIENYGTFGLPWAERECDLSFRIPFDLQETSVNGDKNLWIRCRLVGGSYTCTEGSACCAKPTALSKILSKAEDGGSRTRRLRRKRPCISASIHRLERAVRYLFSLCRKRPTMLRSGFWSGPIRVWRGGALYL